MRMIVGLAGLVILLGGCSPAPAPNGFDRGMLAAFAPLPAVMDSGENPVTPAKVELGRRLYHDPRLSKGGDVSCATCHPLDRFGVDGKPLSEGHLGQKGKRNSPTVYNAAGHFVQFWDGRARNIEEQAKGPVMDPTEMAMESAAAVEAVLRADTSYPGAFARAFPGEEPPLTFDNMARAIGAFERTLTTPSRWDAFLQGDDTALTPAEKDGFRAFTAAGCMACHRGAYVGGEMYSRLGLVKGWPDKSDMGRHQVTGHERDRLVFKATGLRNVAETGPWLHDGSVKSLDEMVRLMAEYQLGKQLPAADIHAIVTWLGALTGEPAATPSIPPPSPADHSDF